MEEIQGQVERITYQNADNGYTVARIAVAGQNELVTIIGSMPGIMVGESVSVRGHWEQHISFGRQLKVEQYRTHQPATKVGIERYLASGLIKGIGPVMAKRIVEKFGSDSLDIIDQKPLRLAEVEGIGKQRIEMISQAWSKQQHVRDIMIYLQSFNISTTYAIKIFKRYGDAAKQLLNENPYRLASDIRGIGFLSADVIAKEMGIKQDDPIRLESGVVYTLSQQVDRGHVYFPRQELVSHCQEVLQVDNVAKIDAAIDKAYNQGAIVIEHSLSDLPLVYTKKMYSCELAVAKYLAALVQATKLSRTIEPDRALQWVEQRIEIKLADMQREAVRVALQCKVMVLTGGPGTGKTTIIRAIITIFSKIGSKILLAAPTGRAAKRMSQACQSSAKTVHRLLEFNPTQGGFRFNQQNPIDCDLLIVDECSMIDLMLMTDLLKALPLQATFILVGDVNQLPSVGAGNVLRDIIDSKILPVVRLTQIFRQAQKSHIVKNAHAINAGQIPYLGPTKSKAECDFFFIQRDDPDEALQTLLHLVVSRIPTSFGFDPMREIQVLAPMNKGKLGVWQLNQSLQMAVNRQKKAINRGGISFHQGDKVMQIRNNYQKMIFNGDIGFIHSIDLEEQLLVVDFTGQYIEYEFEELEELVLAYAISIHKSQGSEFPAVVIPILNQHFIMLQRNLLYTAITRGKSLVVLVGSKKAVAIAVNNSKQQQRYSLLEQRLIQAMQKE